MARHGPNFGERENERDYHYYRTDHSHELLQNADAAAPAQPADSRLQGQRKAGGMGVNKGSSREAFPVPVSFALRP